MAKYKKTSDRVTESFIEKLFTSIGKGLRSGALKTLAKQDPEIGKKMKQIEKTRDEIEKRIKNLPPDIRKKAGSGTYFK
tara:strand:+ start:147 stop:383 length:237 start_codon:yes stop_codon:yes gene_type:complete